MIKATELRIGNKIKVFEDIVGVTDVCDDGTIGTTAYFDGQMGCCGCTEDMAVGIPLTEQWLERLGFVDITEGYRATGQASPVYRIASPVRGQDINLYQEWDYKNGRALGYFLAHFEYVMQYVHQLQNLFFALTGEELTIKETV